VLGAGGTLGFAYHAGTLAALAEATGWDPRTAEVVVGTSAGAVAASLLRAGLSAADLAARTTGEPLTPEGRLLVSRLGEATPMGTPAARHARRPGSTALLRQALLRPGSVRLGAAVAAALPPGALPTETIVRGLSGVLGATWPDRPTWICAVDLDDGARVVFGRPGAPEASWLGAVAASCAVPSLFQPVAIGGRRYVDGGAHSVTNLDVVEDLGLDLVIVSAPMSARAAALRPSLDLPFRAVSAARLAAEVAAVRRRGTSVVVLHPSAADRRLMGFNLMDARRRRSVAVQARHSALEWLRRPVNRRQLESILGGRRP
jgi:NTE family protein